MRRCFEVRVSEAKICLKIFDEDEFPWMRRSAGRLFLRAVSVMLIRPWTLEWVKLPLDMWGRFDVSSAGVIIVESIVIG